MSVSMNFFSPRTPTALAALAALAVAVPAAAAKETERPEAAPPRHQTDAAQRDARPTHRDAGPAQRDARPAPTAPACDNPAGSTVFAEFRDRRTYFQVPDGGFENGAEGWTLDGATVVDGNESFNLAGDADAKSLALPAGSSATSPTVCVTKGHPVFRFVARASGSRKARLRVEVLYTNGKGRKVSRVAGKLRAGQAWRPTKKLAIALGRARGKGRNGAGDVAFRFTPVRAAADWQIDDVFVDPHARR
jgi:hypothetical protein